MYINRKDVIKLTLDRDLQSIQEVRELVARAKEAEKMLSTFPQEKLDDICSSVADACMEHAERLAKMAVQETGFGRWEDKVLKNTLGSRITWESVRDLKTVGLLREDKESFYKRGICYILMLSLALTAGHMDLPPIFSKLAYSILASIFFS